MRLPWIACGLIVCTFLAEARLARAQAQSAQPFGLKVSVDEVNLSFHATDANGLSINDLKVDELSLRDNGKPPRRIVDFRTPQDFPIRAGILMDMSPSMEETSLFDRAIAIEYAQKVLQQQTDVAFIMKFDRLSQISQPWTNNPGALASGVRNHVHLADGNTRMSGTALFDALYGACLNQFAHIDSASGNFILLFSDGEDNASRASFEQAVDMCQRANTAIYSFRPRSTKMFSSGPKTLNELATQSGGRVFHDDEAETDIYQDLLLIETDRRSQYRLIYRPASLKRDGSFHRIDLKAPERVGSIVVRSGYYAPIR
jgi:Ca-activated chloride channel homolog